MASEEARRQLCKAVTAHKIDSEITRGFPGFKLEVLDRRIEATQLLLEWLEEVHELPPEVSTGLKRLLKPGSREPSSAVLADFLSRSVSFLQGD